MASTVVTDMEIVDPVKNPPEVEPFPFQIDVPPPLPTPLTPPHPQHVPPPPPPPLPPEPLLLISLPPHLSNSVADKEDDIVVEFHQNKWKEYVEGTKLKYAPFRKWKLK